MATNAPIMGAQTRAPFNPTIWLTQFETLGGGYAVGEHSLRLAILVGNQTDAELIAARMMMLGLTPDQKTALFAHLRADTAALAEG